VTLIEVPLKQNWHPNNEVLTDKRHSPLIVLPRIGMPILVTMNGKTAKMNAFYYLSVSLRTIPRKSLFFKESVVKSPNIVGFILRNL